MTLLSKQHPSPLEHRQPWLRSAAAPPLLLIAFLLAQLILLTFIRSLPPFLPWLHSPPPPPPPDRHSRCHLGLVYVYTLPSTFNSDILHNCSSLNPWTSFCPFLVNDGLGKLLGDDPLRQHGSWFLTDQFSADVIYHTRIMQHPCRTDKPELASAFYIPFYAGLDVGRYLWISSSDMERDRMFKELLEWLDRQSFWKRNGGKDHFLMVGRITWDFRRSKSVGWGSSFFNAPAMANTTRLLIERDPWDDNEMAVPYPTNFHPRSDSHLEAWQEHLRSRKRNAFFSFAGARRRTFPNDFRGLLLDQCELTRSCRSLDCSEGTCQNSQQAVLDLFLDSTFCLQPRGDSFTRRSTFDCLIAGSIPVFFWHRTAYWQYKWHLPADKSSYSIYISNLHVRNGTKVEEVLKSVALEKVQSMRETIIAAIPGLVYAAKSDSLKRNKDAFDLAVEGVLRKVRNLNLGSGR